MSKHFRNNPTNHTSTLTKGFDRIVGGSGNDPIVATADTLSSGDIIDRDTGSSTLVLKGGGTFDLSLPSKLDGVDIVEAQETTVKAGGVTDPVGDFIPTFTGAKSPDLDVLSFFTTFDGTTFHIGGTLNGNIGTLPTSLYVIGFDRGAGTPRFAAINEPGVLFDSVVTLTGKGVASVNLLAPIASSTPLPANAVHISGSTFEIDVPAALLPSAGLPPSQYQVNLWPRDTSQAGNAAVADFAPENAVLTVSSAPAQQMVTLREGTHLTVNVAADPSGDPAAGITITGADNEDVINLAGGDDKVILWSAKETVNGHGGSNVFQVNADTVGATIDGGGGQSQLLVTGDGKPVGDDDGVVMGSNISNVATVKLDAATSLQLNSIAFIRAIGSDGADTIKAGGINQTLTGGAGSDTLVGFAGGSDTFLDTGAGLNGDSIQGFVASDRIDITDFGFAAAQLTAATSGVNTLVTVSAGTATSTFTMAGAFSADGFYLASDGATGTLVTHS